MGSCYTNEWNVVLTFMSQSKCLRVESFLVCYGFQSAVYTIWRERNSRKKWGGSSESWKPFLKKLTGWLRTRLQLSSMIRTRESIPSNTRLHLCSLYILFSTVLKKIINKVAYAVTPCIFSLNQIWHFIKKKTVALQHKKY